MLLWSPQVLQISLDMPQPANLQNGDRQRHAWCGSTPGLLQISGLGHVRTVLQYRAGNARCSAGLAMHDAARFNGIHPSANAMAKMIAAYLVVILH